MRIRFPNVTLAAGLLLGAAGCGPVGTFMHIVFGDPPIAAQYNPPVVPTLVLVENFNNPDGSTIDGDLIARQVTDELKEKTQLKLVDPDKITLMRDEDGEKYRSMKTAAIGSSVDAKQVIYVDLVQADFNADATGSVVHAVARAKVRVIDVETGRTLWPAGSQRGQEISATEDYDPVDNASAASKRTKMLTELSSRISKLFYTWKADDQTQENSGG
jgi:hypothetical protein